MVAVYQSPFPTFSGLSIYKRDLLKSWVIFQSYNHHVRLLPPESVWFGVTKSPQEGADIVIESLDKE